MMNALVTGGAGFIGSHLVDTLLSKGYNVTALDNFTHGMKEHLAGHKNLKNFKLFKVNLADAKEVLPRYFKHIDYVFHLAGRSDIVPSIIDPVSYHQANVTGTLNILEACRKVKLKKFIYAASYSCYGIPETYPTPETTPPRPKYPYALTKYMGELYALQWQKVYKVPVISLRFSNVYGPRVRVSGDYGPVFSIFLGQKLAGKPFTVVGDGQQTRDFTFVTDVVDAMLTAARSHIVGDFFNVGSGGTYSVNRLVELLGGEVVHIPKRPGEPDCTWADISKIKRVLGWSPKISFEEGIKKVLENLDHWKGAPVWTPKTIKAATKDWFKYLG